jgi:tetratricopeptide (TPR) repeat protein
VLRFLCALVACCLVSLPVSAATVLILPFENRGGNPQADWIGESIAAALSEQFRHPENYVVTREDRIAAFDRLGLPLSLTLSRATILRVAELTAADVVVVGSFAAHGTAVALTAQVIDMRRPRLSQVIQQSGAAGDLLELQQQMGAALAAEAGLPAAEPPRMRLDAWENYIRGRTAPSAALRIRFLREAARLEPSAPGPAFALGKSYFEDRDYQTAIPWLLKLKKEDRNFLEASFLLGLAYYHVGDFERAETFFHAVTETLPLNEAYNNLGVVQSLRRKKAAVDSLQKAEEGDALDPDYTFNLGCYYLRAGDYSQAARHFREALAKNPADADARALLGHSQERMSQNLESSRTRAAAEREDAAERRDRIKANYEEPGFRQLRAALEKAKEDKLETLDVPEQAAAHLAHGREAFEQGRDGDALRELQVTLRLEPQSADAYLYLARVHLRAGRAEEAKAAAANAASFGKKDPEPCLLLARIYLEQGQRTAALQAARQALERDPQNSAAQALVRDLENGPRP